MSHFTAEECVCVSVWREAGALMLSSSLSPSDIKHGSGGLALRLLHSHTQKGTQAHRHRPRKAAYQHSLPVSLSNTHTHTASGIPQRGA